MNRVQLKEYIRKSILEGEYLEDDKDAMDAMDAAMVQDYEDEQANKFALDSEEPLEEATISPDNRVAYLENMLEMVWKLGKGNNTVNFKSLAQATVSHMFDEEPLQEATSNIPDDIQWSVSEVVGRVDDYAVEVTLEGYSPTTDKEYTAYTTAVEIGDGYEWDEVYDVEEVTMEEVVKKANSIVEAWTKRK